MKKKYVLLMPILALAMATTPAVAQKTQKFTAAKGADYGLTYSLPVTHLSITVKAAMTEKKAGPYYKYAQKYLGTTNVVTADSKTWELADVEVHPYGRADDSQRYVMEFKSGKAPFVMKTEDGVLLSINTENVVEQDAKPTLKASKPSVLGDNTYLSSLPGDLLVSGSVAKRAEIAAQQIYKIRQSRSDYATGEAEQMPDGNALKLIMQQLDEQEAALTALFVGTVETREEVKAFDYQPGTENVKNEVLCRISDYDGIVDKTDLSGAPVYISTEVLERGKMPVNEKGEEKKMPKDAVAYKMPGKACFTFSYGGSKVKEVTLNVAQLGIVFGFAPELFTDKKQPAYVKFAPSTGAVVELGNVTDATDGK